MNQEVHFTNIRKNIIDNLRDCNSDLKIAVAWFTDKTIIKEVNALIKNNVNVEIIIYDDHVNQKELFKDLYYSKAKIFLSKKLMHNKFCIIDNQTVINGSYNWTINASSNEENIQITYDDFEFAKKFTDQFNNLSSKCTTIDNHFEYSLSNLENLHFEFEDFYSNWPNYSYPYFINTLNTRTSKENRISKIFGHIYIIKNEAEQKSFLWFYHFLQTKYSVNKLLKIKQQKTELPQKFGFIHGSKFDSNGVSEFKQNDYVVEEHNISNYDSARTRYYLYSINRDGQPKSEKIRYTYKVNDKLYIMHLTAMHSNLKPYFLNNKLKKTNIPYYVMRVLSNYSMVVSNYEKSVSRIGILSVENKIVVPFKYGNWVREPKNDYVDLVEYPILHKVKSKNQVWKPFVDYNNYKEKGHIIDRYSIPDFSLIETFKITGSKHTEDDEYLFLSEENYKYESFYNKIAHLSTKPSLSELNELKAHYLNPSKIDTLLEKYSAERDRLREIENKKKEGCYVATMVYGDYDHPNVLFLRDYRDNILSKYRYGKKFISFYYKYSPKYVNYVNDKKFLNWISKSLIKTIEIGIKTWHNNV
ncbi:phospholipase D-like domain-containing protein [uncultured Salegentibacter sp.]|uniref:phospholipase D-like domain-containing protein n=1 Tax=uncultured Salegentibacter sp. TaxID=259320 RepID=UPI002598A12D|nr:phospholipase D-like domain-containing protein [uncultured Salegentibacter sp.]